MEKGKLIGCISSLRTVGLIKTRFFYVNSTSGEVNDVTKELYLSLQKFNNYADEYMKAGFYMVKIPYSFKRGLAIYPHGCGLSHYLSEELFEEISIFGEGILTFPLTECQILMYTPNEVENILGCKSVLGENIFRVLRERFCA